MRSKKAGGLILTGLGLLLLVINVYGEFSSMRPSNLETTQLRFNEDLLYTYDEAIDKLQKAQFENTYEQVSYYNYIVSKSLAHILWNSETDVSRFNQQIPLKENFILNIMGEFTPIPEFKKYHFTDYKRSLERGIGICGDASMVLYEILETKNIPSQIVSFKGHVVVEFVADSSRFTADPDFGVMLPYSIEALPAHLKDIEKRYRNTGYNDGDWAALEKAYKTTPTFWDGPKHFMTNKYYFERASYILKWLIPILLIIFGIFSYYKNHKKLA